MADSNWEQKSYQRGYTRGYATGNKNTGKYIDWTVRLRAALRQIAAMDPQGVRADDLGRSARIAHEALTDDVGASRPMQPTPYGLAGIEGDVIVIRLTADACAFAFANDPQAREPRPPVINKQQFLRDTLNELTAEREDGSTPLTDMLDRAMVKAMENGSDALDHDATPGVEGRTE